MKAKPTRMKKPDNMEKLRACVQNFAAQHVSADGAQTGSVRGGRRRSRKELRKEERKLKKMRIHAFKQRKPLPTLESLQNDRRMKLKELNEKKRKKQLKQQAQQKKQAEKKKAQDEVDRKEAEFLGNKKRDERLLKQLEKSLKMKKNKKSLPSAFITDGLDYILDVVDPDKVKSMSEEINAESLWKESELCSDQEDDSATDGGLRKRKQAKKDRKSSDMEVDSEGELSDDSDEGDFFMNTDEQDDGEESSDEDADSDDDHSVDEDDDDSVSEDDMVEDDESEDVGVVKQQECHSSSNKRMAALADFVSSASAENVKGILKSDIETSKRQQKQVQFSSNTSDAVDGNLLASNESSLHEDIYGRLRDKQGNVVTVSGNPASTGSTYVPPGKRQQLLESKLVGGDKIHEEDVMLSRQLKGQINRLSENNLQSVGNTIDALYREHSRAKTTHALTVIIFDACLLPSLAPTRVCSDIALLIALLHHRVGTEVSLTFIQSLIARYCQLFEELVSNPDADKRIENALTLLCWLYSFKVISNRLILDVANQLVERFSERDIELLLIILKGTGYGLRKDNADELKTFLNTIQVKAASTDCSKSSDSSRVKYLLDTLINIRANSDLKLLGSDEKQHMQHLHKLLNVYSKGSRECELRVTLDDLLNASQNGKWFVVGAAWHGQKQSEDKNASSTIEGLPTTTSSLSGKLAKKAKKLGMNTDMRRSVFNILATCENYVDAFEKVMQLSAQKQQQKQRETVYREVVYVIMQLCLHEKQQTSEDENSVNMFYIFLLERLCQSHCKRHVQVAVKFTVRHQIQLAGETDSGASRLTRLADVTYQLIARSIIGLAVLKDVDFINISKPMHKFLKRLLHKILSQLSDAALETIFGLIVEKPPLLSKQIQLFIKLFFKRQSDDEELQRRIKLAENAMTSFR